MERFLNNREIIKDLKINTGTSQSPTYTTLCTLSEINVTTDFEMTDWYVFCDAIQRSLITGASVSLDTTVKLDIENTAIQTLIDNIHTLITNGEVAQFNNQQIQFSLLSGVTAGVLEYTTYTSTATLEFSDLGGSAEEEGEFSLNIHINGTSTETTSA